MINYAIDNKTISINGKGIDFKHRIYMVVEMNDLIIVLIRDISNDKLYGFPLNNVYAIDRQGNIIWCINELAGRDLSCIFIGINGLGRLIIESEIGRFDVDAVNKQAKRIR